MRRLVGLAWLVLAVACSEGSDGDGRIGEGGSGGAPSIPDEVDQLCRTFCANDAGGQDCGPESCSRINNDTTSCSDIQACYESCLEAYALRAAPSTECPDEHECFAPPPRCVEEWETSIDCVLALECDDLFGDCDDEVETIRECESSYDAELSDLRAQWCLETCPDEDTCVTDGKCFVGTTGGTGGTGGRPSGGDALCEDVCAWPSSCLEQFAPALGDGDCTTGCEDSLDTIGLTCLEALNSAVFCLGTCNEEELTVSDIERCEPTMQQLDSAC